MKYSDQIVAQSGLEVGFGRFEGVLEITRLLVCLLARGVFRSQILSSKRLNNSEMALARQGS